MIQRLSALLLVFVIALGAFPAWAGGVISIEGSSPSASASQDRENARGESEPLNATPRRSNTGAFLLFGTSGPRVDSGPGPLVNEGMNVVFFPVTGEEDSGQDVGAHLDSHHGFEIDYDEFADVGCGGAQAASGPIGFVPFAVAGLALLFRRRRS